MGSRRRPRWRAAGALALARGARCECSHRAFAANLVRDGGGMARNSRRVCTHRESSAMDVAATATVRLATCVNVGDASTCRRWPAPQTAHIGLPPPSRRPPPGTGRGGRDARPPPLFGLVPLESPVGNRAPRVHAGWTFCRRRSVDALPTGETFRRRGQMSGTSRRVYT